MEPERLVKDSASKKKKLNNLSSEPGHNSDLAGNFQMGSVFRRKSSDSSNVLDQRD